MCDYEFFINYYRNSSKDKIAIERMICHTAQSTIIFNIQHSYITNNDDDMITKSFSLDVCNENVSILKWKLS